MKLFFIKLKIQVKNGGLISMKIKVVDSIMGSGKTSWAISKMNYNDNKKYVYITPYLSEVKRIKDNVTKQGLTYFCNNYDILVV